MIVMVGQMMKMIPYKFNFLARAKVDNLTDLIQRVVDKLKDLVRKFNAAVERAKKSIDDAKDACYKLYPPKWEDVSYRLTLGWRAQDIEPAIEPWILVLEKET